MRAPLSSWVIPVKVIELQKSILETWKSFTAFLNTLTADDKYSLSSRDKWMQTIQMDLSQQEDIFLNFFDRFSNFHYVSNIFKKRLPSYFMFFRNYRPRKACLDKCLKAPLSGDLSTGDMVNGPKHWGNLNQSAFIILRDHCEGNWVANVTLRHMKILRTFS